MLPSHWCWPRVVLMGNPVLGVCFSNSLLLYDPSDLLFAAPSPPKGHVALSPMTRTDIANSAPNPQLWGASFVAIPLLHICLSCSQAGPWQQPHGLMGAGDNQVSGM